MLLISVIIPAYNSQNTIELCIASVLSSDYENLEVIVVDDGSTDKTSDLASDFKDIIILKKINGGAASARNYGACIAKGDFFYFLDSDVEIEVDTIRRMAKGASEYQVDLVNVCYSILPANEGLAPHYKALVDYVLYTPKAIRGSVHINSIERDPNNLITLGGGGDFVSKRAFEQLGGYDEERYSGASVEREEFYFRFWKAGFTSISDPTIKTRHHFPGFLSIFKNYYQRLKGTLELMEGNTLRFGNYNKLKTLATTGTALIFLMSPLFKLGPPIMNSVCLESSMVLFLIFMTLSRDFFSISYKTKGLKKTLYFVPIHVVSQAAILIFGITSLILISMKRVLPWDN